MSGDRPPVHLDAPAGSVLARAVEALGRFPGDGSWALVGGVAVFIRLGSVTRPTADADTVARSQAELLDRLVAGEVATIVSGGELEVPVAGGAIEIDVMDLADDPLPGDAERRAFALARRHALDGAVSDRIIVSADGSVVVDVTIPVATAGALIALKTVSMVRRPHGKSPQKVGSDIHDLVRLVGAFGARSIAADLATDAELGTWVADQVACAFGTDLRYTLLRLRSNERSPGAQALTDPQVEATVVLADELTEQLGQRLGPYRSGHAVVTNAAARGITQRHAPNDGSRERPAQRYCTAPDRTPHHPVGESSSPPSPTTGWSVDQRLRALVAEALLADVGVETGDMPDPGPPPPSASSPTSAAHRHHRNGPGPSAPTNPAAGSGSPVPR